MDAIKLLEQQHQEVELLFDKAVKARSAHVRQQLFEHIGDSLAVHATIEEKIFYPAAKSASTRDILFESVEEHLAAKRLIADLIRLSPDDEHFSAKLIVLKEEIHHHIGEERKELFPKAKKLLDDAQRLALGEQMEVMADALQHGSRAPRLAVPAEIAKAADLE